jgi:hypothetical protein
VLRPNDYWQFVSTETLTIAEASIEAKLNWGSSVYVLKPALILLALAIAFLTGGIHCVLNSVFVKSHPFRSCPSVLAIFYEGSEMQSCCCVFLLNPT